MISCRLDLRTYTATLSYLPAGSDEETTALPPLNEPLPAGNWITSTGKFISIYSSTLPFIGTDLLIAPQSKIDDGIIWLFIIRGIINVHIFQTFENFTPIFLLFSSD